jgi:hypothetical protein
MAYNNLGDVFVEKGRAVEAKNAPQLIIKSFCPMTHRSFFPEWP